jgi:hypothetical protein
MLLDLFIFFEVITIGIFLTAFFTHQEILWALTSLFSATLAFSSYSVQYYIYQFNISISAYSPIMVTYSYPYLSAINWVFFGLSLALGIFDLFDKYGTKLKGA